MDSDFAKREQNGVFYYVGREIEKLGWVRHGFSTRHRGVSAEDHFLQAIGCRATRMDTLAQIHSDRIHILEANEPADLKPEADAIATDLPNRALAIRVADCLPILMVDPAQKIIAAVHAGWRGALARIGAKTIAGLQEKYGTDPRDLIAAVGPGIRPCCFEVGAEVQAQFAAEFPGEKIWTPHPERENKFYIDLPGVIRIQLTKSGMSGKNIFELNKCTSCHRDEFFSYRAEGAAAGRMMAVIEKHTE
jgi:YfiH family protein